MEERELQSRQPLLQLEGDLNDVEVQIVCPTVPFLSLNMTCCDTTCYHMCLCVFLCVYIYIYIYSYILAYIFRFASVFVFGCTPPGLMGVGAGVPAVGG